MTVRELIELLQENPWDLDKPVLIWQEDTDCAERIILIDYRDTEVVLHT